MSETAIAIETLGDLIAGDLGARVSFKDGGATYEGTLVSVKHDSPLFPDSPLGGHGRTWVSLKAFDDWRLFDAYPSDTPCTVVYGDDSE